AGPCGAGAPPSEASNMKTNGPDDGTGSTRSEGARPPSEPAAVPSAVTVDRVPDYLAYYGLREPPFRATHDPARLWLGRGHREVLATLSAAVRRGRGVAVLTGEAGTGKTSLVGALV